MFRFRRSSRTVVVRTAIVAILIGLGLFFSVKASATVREAFLALFFDTAAIEITDERDPAGLGHTTTATLVSPMGIWNEDEHLFANDGLPNDLFGYSVAISGDTGVVGAPSHDLPGLPSAGAAYVFIRSGSTWSLQQKLTASDAVASQSYGTSVSIAGNTIIVGAHGNASMGAAYVYTRSGTLWSQQQKLTASDGVAGDRFGYSVAIHSDTAVIGSVLDDTPGGTDAGSAYVFTRSGTVWSQQQKLLASDGGASDEFGTVAIDGETVVVGGRNNNGTSSDVGAAYVFTRSGTVWSQQQKLTAADALAGDRLGSAVAISGNTIAAASDANDNANGTDAGAAYVFTRSGTVWS